MKIYKKLLGIIFLLLSFNSLAQEKIYKIATDIDFPPFQYRNSRNELIGIDIELLEAIAKNQNFKYEILELGFQGAINALNNGEVDAIFSAMTITDKRKEKYDFSNPYVKNGIALAVKEDSDITSYEDLKGKTVTIRTGTVRHDFVSKISDKYNFYLVHLDDDLNLVEDVVNNMSDACFEDSIYIRYNISKGEKIKLVIEEKPHLECGVMVLKGKNQELLEKINKGLKELEKNGTYRKIMDKYLVGYNESL